MVRYNYPVAATVVGLILGNLVEGNLLRTYQISGGDFAYALERPGALFILALMVLSFGVSAYSKARRKRHDGVAMGAT
jgi:putative tricarboxylic transport membrane protein